MVISFSYESVPTFVFVFCPNMCIVYNRFYLRHLIRVLVLMSLIAIIPVHITAMKQNVICRFDLSETSQRPNVPNLVLMLLFLQELWQLGSSEPRLVQNDTFSVIATIPIHNRKKKCGLLINADM